MAYTVSIGAVGPVLSGERNKKVIHMNKRLKQILICLLAAAVAFGLGVLTLACLLRPQVLEVGEPDLSTVADGEYIGVCQNKLLFAVVRVEVEAHRIAGVEVLWHKESYMPQARQTAERIAAAQSLRVDAVSGATLTATTVQKAVENAIAQGN